MSFPFKGSLRRTAHAALVLALSVGTGSAMTRWSGVNVEALPETLAEVTPEVVNPALNRVAAVGPWATIGSGQEHACGLVTGGIAYCWGDAGSGKLGDGTFAEIRPAPFRVITPVRFTSIGGGSNHTCALTSGGTPYCWGQNGNGQLGTGNNLSQNTPVQVSGGLNLVSLSVGNQHTCGLTNSGAAWCWGENQNGQLGIGTQTHSNVPVQVAGLTFRSIGAGSNYTCGVATDNVAYCWGLNTWGQVGDGTNANIRTLPTRVSGPVTFKSVSAGGDHTCGIGTNDRVYCWGINWAGQLGTGNNTDNLAPTLINTAQTFSMTRVGFNNSCALSTLGTVFCWGRNDYGQVGDGSFANRTNPTQVSGLTGVNFITVWDRTVCASTQAGDAFCWGSGNRGTWGNGVLPGANTRRTVSGGLPFTQVSAGEEESCGLTAAGAAYCWGYNATGGAGIGNGLWTATPTAVVGGHVFRTLTVGSQYACGIRTDNALYCWGNNPNGQLGTGNQSNTTTPTAVMPGTAFASVSAGNSHTCAITTANAGYCWGRNLEGQLGIGSVTSLSNVPVGVTGGHSWKSIIASDNYTCGLNMAGTAYCWGSNASGRLGTANGVTVNPTLVGTTQVFASLDAGQNHVCALTAAGNVFCWGENTIGQFGDGTTGNSTAPRAAANGLVLKKITAGLTFTCGITTADATYCWGRNEFGQVGNGTSVNQLLPALVAGTTADAWIDAGRQHVCAATGAGATCWGRRAWGLLGDGTVQLSNTPITVVNPAVTGPSDLAIGDTVPATIGAQGERDNYYITLQLGDTIDIAALKSNDVWGVTQQFLFPRIEVYGPTGALVATNLGFRNMSPRPGAVIPRFIVTQPGNYLIRVSDRDLFNIGPYVLKTRRTGPILQIDPLPVATNAISRVIAAPTNGAVTQDTVWVYNPGKGPITWNATSSTTWMSVSPSSGTLQPAPSSQSPSREVVTVPARAGSGENGAPIETYTSAELAPAGSVPLVVSVNPGTFLVGTYTATLSFTSSDSWSGNASTFIRMRVYNAAITTVAKLPNRAQGVARQADGQLLIGAGGALHRFNPATSTLTQLAVVNATNPLAIYGVTIAANGTPYVAALNRLHRVNSDNSLTTVFEGAVTEFLWDAAVLPDGTIYIVLNTRMVRIDPLGAQTTPVNGAGMTSIAYSYLDGMIYFAQSGLIKRFHPAEQIVTNFASSFLPGTGGFGIHEIDVARDGRIAAKPFGGPDLFVYSSNGDLLFSFYAPQFGSGLAMAEGRLYLTGYDLNNAGGPSSLMQLLVPDGGPALPNTRYVTARSAVRRVVPFGSSFSDTLNIRTNDGVPSHVNITHDASWLTISPDSSTTPMTLTLGISAGNLSGLLRDTIRVQADGVGNSPLKIPVEVSIERGIVLGDSVLSTLTVAGQIDTFKVALTAGDTVDIGMFSREDYHLDVRLNLRLPNGAVALPQMDDFPGRNYDAIIRNYIVPETGLFRILADAWAPQIGRYALKVRSSGGAMVVSEPAYDMHRSAPQIAATYTDTLWLYNIGDSPATFTIEKIGAWFTIDKTSGTLNPIGASPALTGSKPALTEASPDAPSGVAVATSRANAPAGATPIIVTSSTDGLDLGNEYGLLTITVPEDTWSGPLVIPVSVHIHDNRLEVVMTNPGDYRWGIAKGPDDDLILSVGRHLDRVNIETGVRTDWIRDVIPSPANITALARAADGSFYVGGGDGRIVRVSSTGVATPITQATGGQIWDFAVAPGDTLYVVASGNRLYRLAPGGTLVEAYVGSSIRGVGYNPANGYVYFGDENTLKRLRLSDRTVENVGPLPLRIYEVEFGQSGKMYARSIQGFPDLFIFNEDGSLAEQISSIGLGYKVLLWDGYLYGGMTGGLFRLDVQDNPVPPDSRLRIEMVATNPALSASTSTPVAIRAMAQPGTRIGSASGRVYFRYDVAQVDSITRGNYVGALTTNLSMQADSGFVRFAVANATPADRDTTDLAIVWFKGRGAPADTTTVSLLLSDLSSAEDGFPNLLPFVSAFVPAHLHMGSGVWGDTDYTWRDFPGVAPVGSKDALICLTHIVGNNVSAFDASACDVAPDNGLIYNGTINARDALVILSKVVGRNVAEFRVGQAR